MAGTPGQEKTEAPATRPSEEDVASLTDVGTDADSLSRTKSESRGSVSMLTSTSSAETQMSQGTLQTRILEDPVGWSAKSQILEPDDSAVRIAKAQAWEIHALEAQTRGIQPTQSSLLEVTLPSVLKSKPSKEQIPEAEGHGGDESFTRSLWPRKLEYFLVLLSYMSRPGNIWHFTYLWLHKGGSSFFLVYLAMLLVVGTPLLFLEMAVGQRMQRSTMDMWRAIGPWAGGVGYTSFMVCLITSMYLNVFNAWIIFYLSFSFRFPVPWEKCALLKNSSGFDPECARTTPSMYFWYRQTLKVSDRIEVSEPPVWSLSLPFFISWCLTGAFLTNGLKSLGKVIGILILFPGIIILCFLIRGFMLEGAVHGLKHLLEVKVSTFYDLNVWIIAGCQVLFDLGLGFGPIASLSSHLVQSNNCLYDAIILTLASLAVRLFLMPCFLSVLGFWATIITNRCYEKNTETILMLIDLGILPPVALPPVYVRTNPALNYSTWFHGLPEHIRNMVLSKVPECSIENQLLKVWEGPRFAFLALVEVTSFMPASVLWSALFFVMLLNLGLGTTLGYMQGMVIPLQDSCLFFRTKVKLSLAGLSMLLFLGGLFFTRPAGIYFIRLLSDYWTILPIIVIVMCENLLVAWVYGARRFLTELRALLNCSIPHLCGCLWCYVTPSVLLGLLITIIFQIFVKPITYVAWDSETSTEVTRLYPRWSLILMLSLFLVVIIPIPGYIGYCLIYKIPFRPSHKNSLLQSLESPPQKNQIMPSDEVQRQEV